MVFSSNLFLFGFLPVFFSIYCVLPKQLRNHFLLFASLCFYEFGAGPVVLVLIASIAVNYIAGRVIESSTGTKRQAWFWSAVFVNVAALAYYKYAGFLWDVGNDLTGGAFATNGIARPHVPLPIGISFFTFQALSYIADIYLRHGRAARTLAEFGTYHTLFPLLIAGPIVRFGEVRREIADRSISLPGMRAGLMRVTIGLAKKVIIADNAGLIADAIFRLEPSWLSPSTAWLGAVAYSIQILFDFSGYSDMAIGIGLILGFQFPENFNAPYQASSITEFWRRWHMTLSRWFRDYVYIQLGGNRAGLWRTYVNLVTVFLLCGLWHGAGYTFVIWGLLHGALLIFERALRERWNIVPAGLLGQAWTVLMVMLAWVFFRAATPAQALAFLSQMMFVSPHVPDAPTALNFLPPDRAFYLALGALIALVPLRWPLARIEANFALAAFRRAASLALFAYTLVQLSANAFNPFIYFRF